MTNRTERPGVPGLRFLGPRHFGLPDTGYTRSADTHSYPTRNSSIRIPTTGQRDGFRAAGSDPSPGSSGPVTKVLLDSAAKKRFFSPERSRNVLILGTLRDKPLRQVDPRKERHPHANRLEVPITVVLSILLVGHEHRLRDKQTQGETWTFLTERRDLHHLPGDYSQAISAKGDSSRLKSNRKNLGAFSQSVAALLNY